MHPRMHLILAESDNGFLCYWTDLNPKPGCALHRNHNGKKMTRNKSRDRGVSKLSQDEQKAPQHPDARTKWGHAANTRTAS